MTRFENLLFVLIQVQIVKFFMQASHLSKLKPTEKVADTHFTKIFVVYLFYSRM